MKTAKRPKSDKLLLGAHAKGGLKGAVSHAMEIGATPIQIFIGSPQTWKEPSPYPEEFSNFKRGVKDNSLGPVFVHGNYLVNLAANSPENLKKSVSNLHAALRLADRAGAAGLIFHAGSAGKLPQREALERVVKCMADVLEDYTGDCRLLVEVCAGQGQTIGDNFDELAAILHALDYDKKLGICWDTCHLFNAGYDVSTEKGLQRTVSEFGDKIGFQWLYAIHANDSKTPLGARRDRHENIGQGHIGEEGFARMLHHPLLRPLPWILEVPGFTANGPDKENIDILKRLSA